jgi:sodium transport system permease protein
MALISSLVLYLESPAGAGTQQHIQSILDLLLPARSHRALAYLAVAITPAICEELLFRGAIQGMLRKTLSTKVVVVVVGCLFATMHASLARFLPTAFIGVALAMVAEVSGSIVPCMLIHGLNNAIGIYCLGKNPPLTMPLVCAITIAGVIAVLLLKRSGKAKSDRD